jgi:hypothetical protein
MIRRSQPWVMLLVLGVVAGLIVLVVTGRSSLSDARRQVDERWSALQSPLNLRYEQLGEIGNVALQAGGNRTVLADITQARKKWITTMKNNDIDGQIHAANTLEGLSRRLAANVAASAKLRSNEELTSALVSYAASTPPEPLLNAYAKSADRYANSRTAIQRRLAAAFFQYDVRPNFFIT